jgi:glycosyltransferase involved in cell wall biosynthesis
MNILHICNDFSYSKVHANLYLNLDKFGFQQTIYHPLRDINNIGKNVFDFHNQNSKIFYSRLLKNYHRLFFRQKIKYLYNDIRQKIDFKKIDMQYATTLFSDGALAYKIYNNFKIPYIVALRNTDINLFLKVRPDLYVLGKNILLNAQKIIFISPSLKNLFFSNRYFSQYENQLLSRIMIIPNGIDDYWLENLYSSNESNTNKFLFIGRFDRNKNVIRLIKTIEKCRDNVPNIELNLVGGDGNLHNEVLKLIKSKNWINYYGKIYDKNKLREIFRMNDFFAMPSIRETFGLVYIEALSQGLPILYTKGQGVDGLFEDEVGVATSPKNEKKLEKDLMFMMDNRMRLKENIKKVNFSLFDWVKTALIYREIFNEV